MSLDIACSEGYINIIENQKIFPSMRNFFYICDYFQITPKQFFDDGNDYPRELENLIQSLKSLYYKQLSIIQDIINQMKKHN